MKRRTFLTTGGASSLLAARALPAETAHRPVIDFHYAPLDRQTAFCSPDDPDDSLLSRKGSLRYGHDRVRNVHHFPQTVEFSLTVMDDDPDVVQGIKARGFPIVRTRIVRSEAVRQLITIATGECILVLRQIVPLEDGHAPRLPGGIGPQQLPFRKPFALQHTPTDFGLLDVKFQPERRRWRLTLGLECGPAPARPTLSASAGTLRLASAERARSQCVRGVVESAPEQGSLNAVWART